MPSCADESYVGGDVENITDLKADREYVLLLIKPT